ncbi:MAG: hypothetical protein L3J79_07080 [Candidatus Marinimicrobia bacterium]|nr:hypothetical protein [Candidatus Neomarinimicrobiota bacterium]
MGGSSILINKLEPIAESASAEADADHVGRVDITATNLFGLYGISNRINLTWSLPYKYWKQYEVEHEDTHHRNEKIQGLGDLEIGIRGIVKNAPFGPGQRIFIDASLSLPTADSYQLNPFSEDADEVEHSHFALGAGQYALSLGAEWWHRSEFPIVFGLAGRVRESLNESSVGFKSGRNVNLALHSIWQKPIFQNLFPYLKLNLQHEVPDLWEGLEAPNSGGSSLGATGQLIWEVNDQVSLITGVGAPVWQDFQGSQLSGVNYFMSFRYLSF